MCVFSVCVFMCLLSKCVCYVRIFVWFVGECVFVCVCVVCNLCSLECVFMRTCVFVCVWCVCV